MITQENSIPKKSDRYLFAEGIFFEQFNRVEFYFEDQNKEELYYGITKKIFFNIEFNRIFTLNGKKSVIEKAEKSLGRKQRIFILDKDFDDILNVKRTDLSNIFYLDKYSIENYFLEEEAIIFLLITQMPTKTRRDLKYNHQKALKKISESLKTIVCYQFLAHKYRLPNIKTVSLPLEYFLDSSDHTRIDKMKILAYRKQVKMELEKIKGKSSLLKELNIAKNELKYYDKKVMDNLPGKQCVHYLSKIFRKAYPSIGNLQLERTCFLLASKCTFKSLSNLQEAIVKRLNT